ncbi:MAG: DUF6249 domain-containing protein [Leeuwenhoekiella sp.]
MEAAFVFSVLILAIFGIFYLHFSTRNKERLALIEKGADARIFGIKQNREAPPVWKILILNFGLLLSGVGLGIILGIIFTNSFDLDREMDGPVYTSCIFLMSGISLIIGFFLTKKWIK